MIDRRPGVLAAAGLFALALAAFPSRLGAQTKLPEALSLAAADKEILIADAAGRAIRFEKQPRAILALGADAPAIAHLMAAFPQGRERLIGIERAGRPGDPLLALIDPSFGKKSVLASDPSLTSITALKPDLVLRRGRKPDARDTDLASAGVAVVHLGLDSPEQYERDLGILGAILGAKERADELILFYRGLYGGILMNGTYSTTADRPRILMAAASLQAGAVVLTLPPLSSMSTQLVRAAGGTAWEDAADKGSEWKTVSLLSIASWNPDVIVLSVPVSTDPAAVIAGLRSDPRSRALRAVSSGRVFTLPGDIDDWNTPDPRWVLGLSWLAAQINTGRFPHYDLDKTIDVFFSTLYGLDQAAVAAVIRPALRQSAR